MNNVHIEREASKRSESVESEYPLTKENLNYYYLNLCYTQTS